MSAETKNDCPDCPHQRIVHGLSGGCTAKYCDCERDTFAQLKSPARLAGSEAS